MRLKPSSLFRILFAAALSCVCALAFATDPSSGKTAAARAKAARHASHDLTAQRTTVAHKRALRHGVRAIRVSAVQHASLAGRASIGHSNGLHAVDDPLDLRSAVALVIDQRSGDVLLAKNPQAILPIASITKLMTAMVVLDAQLPLEETLEVSQADVDLEKGSRSRLRPGFRLSRGEMLQLALMSSENRAAHALGRHYPGGLSAFVESMNAKARLLGMSESSFNDPTGLSSRNVSNAKDLSTMVRAAFEYPLIRQFSTATGLTVDPGRRVLSYHTTNRLVDNPSWSIGLQKTGYISEAGSCLVMQVSIEGRQLVMVLLDSQGRLSRFGDALRIRQWIERDVRQGPSRAGPIQTSYGS